MPGDWARVVERAVRIATWPSLTSCGPSKRRKLSRIAGWRVYVGEGLDRSAGSRRSRRCIWTSQSSFDRISCSESLARIRPEIALPRASEDFGQDSSADLQPEQANFLQEGKGRWVRSVESILVACGDADESPLLEAYRVLRKGSAVRRLWALGGPRSPR